MCALPRTPTPKLTIAQYSNHNALGGELHAAGPAIHRAEVVTRATLAYEVPRAIPVDENGSYSPPLQRFSMEERETVTPGPKRAPRTTRAGVQSAP